MQAAIRHGDHAIVAVSTPIPPAEPGTGYTWTTLAPRDDADIVTLTQRQMAHWLSLELPPGEVMALADDGSIYVLTYAQPDPAVEALRALVASHPDPAVQEAARRLGIGVAP